MREAEIVASAVPIALWRGIAWAALFSLPFWGLIWVFLSS